MIRYLTAILVTAGISFSASAQDSEPSFADRASEHVYGIDRDGSEIFSGAGWKRLVDAAGKVHFFLIGEKHAAKDIAQFQKALHAAIAPSGFDHMVVEVGPWSTRFAEKLLRSEKEDALGAFIASPNMQFTLPFLFFREEIDLVKQAVGMSPHSDQVLWGVDQEFLGAGPIMLMRLLELAETEAQRDAVKEFGQGVASSFMYLGTAADENLAKLAEAFTDGQSEARELIDAIILTHRIYGPFTRGTGPIYPANLERENYMKDNFLEHFSAAEKRLGYPPKAVFKFGGYHLERGLSGTNVPSFGNFILEWGRSRGLSSTNVLVDCNGGEAYAIMSGGPAPCTSYALDEDSPLLAAIGNHDVALIDLAALRPALSRFKDLDPKTRDLVLSYDFYVAMSNVEAQTPVADLTFPSN